MDFEYFRSLITDYIYRTIVFQTEYRK